jgi:hypothetical protein
MCGSLGGLLGNRATLVSACERPVLPRNLAGMGNRAGEIPRQDQPISGTHDGVGRRPKGSYLTCAVVAIVPTVRTHSGLFSDQMSGRWVLEPGSHNVPACWKSRVDGPGWRSEGRSVPSILENTFRPGLFHNGIYLGNGLFALAASWAPAWLGPGSALLTA